MNNPKLTVPKPGRRATDVDGAPIPPSSGQPLGDAIFDLIGTAADAGKTLTIWDLRKVLDVSLHEVFVGLRVLEYDRLVCRGTPSQDPLSSPVTLTDKGRKIYFG